MRTEDFWAGQFGQEYLERNRIDPRTRLDFWRSAVEFCEPHSVFEVGCNRGHNLLAIQMANPSAELYGLDVNETAVNEAREVGIEAQKGSALALRGLYEPGSMDLVFTAGVLIHIAPSDLEGVMSGIIATSGRYVLAVEYFSEHEEEVEYRGHSGKLWKRPFGKLYQDMGLTLLSEGVAGGFDQCSYWLLAKS